MADSEVLSDEMKDIVPTPAAIEPEPQTHSVEEVYRVFLETRFCASSPQSNNLFSRALGAVCYNFPPQRSSEIDGEIKPRVDASSIACGASQTMLGFVSSFQSETPSPETLGQDHIPSPCEKGAGSWIGKVIRKSSKKELIGLK